MNKGRKSIGLVALIAGGGLILASMYVSGQVESGREQISSAQQQVDTGKAVFSLTPQTKQASKPFFSSAEGKIAAGTAEADYYERMAKNLMTAGIIVAVIGLALILFL